MNAICEVCKEAYHFRHTRGTKLKDCTCPQGHSGLIFATWHGYDLKKKMVFFRGVSRPDLIFPVRRAV